MPTLPYKWQPQPTAAAFVRRAVADLLQKLPEAAAFAERLGREAGVRFGYLIDTIQLGDDDERIGEAEAAGWMKHERSCFQVWQNPTGQFPLVASDYVYDAGWNGIDLKVESAADFYAANGLHAQVGYTLTGEPGGTWRQGFVFDSEKGRWTVLERHGRAGWTGQAEPDLPQMLLTSESFRLRQRHYATETEAFHDLDALLADGLTRVGRSVACDLFFAAEREYWQRRNAAGRFQKGRQDAMGVGWANHDHHVYRSSRRHFHRLVGLWETLGFHCRERFYANGVGVQVMEQPVCGLVTLNAVDLDADEAAGDFAHEPLADRDALGPVGLWCALHGESVLQAGMHALGCRFDFDAIRRQLRDGAGIETLPPLVDVPHFKHALTAAERWPVKAGRIDALVARKLITDAQADEFRRDGAAGSHLGLVERNDGFKGFA